LSGIGRKEERQTEVGGRVPSASGGVLLAQGAEFGLLGTQAVCRRTSGLCFYGAVLALPASVRQGLTGLDELREDTAPDPPSGRRWETGEEVGGDGTAVIGADPLGQAKLLKGKGEDRFCAGNSRGMESLPGGEAAAEAIGGRKRGGNVHRRRFSIRP
jgi:hypothetical protein